MPLAPAKYGKYFFMYFVKSNLIYLIQENAYNKLIRPSGRTVNGTPESKLTVKLGMRLSQLLEVVSSHFYFLNL
jgi:hypothetical protein